MAKLVALGEVMMKLEVPDHRLLEQADNLQVSYSGTGLNVLSGLSGLGHKTALVSALPNNAVGKAALKSIRARGIETEAMIWSGEYIGHYILEHGFSIRPSNVVYSNRSESSFCQSELSQYNLIGKVALKSIRARGIVTKALICSGEYIGHYILEHGISIRPSNVVYSNRSESSFCQSELSQYNLDLIFDDTSLIHICGIMLA